MKNKKSLEPVNKPANKLANKPVKYAIQKYAVIVFDEEDGKLFECIPELWFVDETKTSCFWPPVSGKAFKLRAINCEKPDVSWTECECSVVSGGHLTYAAGFKIVQEKCSQKYNTSSADEQIEAATFRRNHPGLLAQGERSIESVFVKSNSTSYDNSEETASNENEQTSKTPQEHSLDKTEKNVNSTTGVDDNVKPSGSKTVYVSSKNSKNSNKSKRLSPHRESGSKSNNRSSRSRSRLRSHSRSNSKTSVRSTKEKRNKLQKDTQNLENVNELNSEVSGDNSKTILLDSSSNNNNVRSTAGGLNSNTRSTHSSRSHSIHSSRSRSSHSRHSSQPRSDHSNKPSSRHSCSISSRSRRSRSRRSRSRRSRSRRSRSRSSRSLHSRRSRSRRSRSRSSRSRRSRSSSNRSRSIHSRRSSQLKKSILNRSNHPLSRPSHSKQSQGRRQTHFDRPIPSQKKSNEKLIRQQQQQHPRGMGANKSNSSKRMEVSKKPGNLENSVMLSRSKVHARSNQKSRITSENNSRRSRSRTQSHQRSRSRSNLRNNSSSRSRSRFRSRSDSVRSRQDSNTDLQLSNKNHESTSTNEINEIRKSIKKIDERITDSDRRSNRMEVTLNKIYIMIRDMSGNINDDLESDHGYDLPNIPIERMTELAVIKGKLKDKAFRNFWVNYEKDYCCPTKTSTDNVTITKYLNRFISLRVRCKLTLKEKGASGLTLFHDYYRVYLFLIDVMRAGYRSCNKPITFDAAHSALRVVWGRSKQLLSEQNKKDEKRKTKKHR